jgi:solute carrier family 25 (mitochondrial carnitine/acylcarnitine transporter), member 20/29
MWGYFIVTGFSSYFVAYELMTRSVENPSAFYTLMAGGFAGTFSWLVSFPIDVVKSRFQANGMNGKLEYTGVIDCIRKSYQAEGLGFLSRGLASTLMRAFPMNAVCFLIVSYTMKLFGGSEINIDLNLPTDKPLTMINVGPLIMPIMPNQDRDHHVYRFKMNTMKSLIMLGAFSEAVCSSEIIEITNDLYDESGFCHNYYYQQDIDAYSNYDIVLKSVESNTRNSYPLLSD